MEEQVYDCGKMTVKWSDKVGWDVISTSPIAKDEVIESANFIAFPRISNFADSLWDFLNAQGFLSEKEKYAENLRQNLKFKHPRCYFFKWIAPVPLNGEQISYTVIPLGKSCTFNSRNAFNNIGWKVLDKTFVFTAITDIKEGESLCSFYGYFLDELAQIFSCENVFNLAIEKDKNNISKVYAVRFGAIEDFQASQSNASYKRLNQLLSIAQDGLMIFKLVGLAQNLEEKFGLDCGLGAPLSFLYSKIQELRNNFPFVKIIFEYIDKNDSQNSGQAKQEAVIFKK